MLNFKGDGGRRWLIFLLANIRAHPKVRQKRVSGKVYSAYLLKGAVKVDSVFDMEEWLLPSTSLIFTLPILNLGKSQFINTKLSTIDCQVWRLKNDR